MSGKIEKIYAFLSVDPTDGNEGICGVLMKDKWFPLITGTPALLPKMRTYAAGVAENTKMPLKLVEFSVRRELEDLKPWA